MKFISQRFSSSLAGRSRGDRRQQDRPGARGGPGGRDGMAAGGIIASEVSAS